MMKNIFNRIRKHTVDNRGEYSEKIMLILIAFIAGSILIGLFASTLATGGPVENWAKLTLPSIFSGKPIVELGNPTVPVGPLPSNATVVSGNQSLIESGLMEDGDAVAYGDYRYTYSSSLDGWSVVVLDKSKTSYGPILQSLGGKNIKSLDNAFASCTKLTSIANLKIPNTVTSMYGTFSRCTALTDVNGLFIPKSVRVMTECFLGCRGLIDASQMVISEGVTELGSMFYRCVALTKAPVIPSTATAMWHTFTDCTSLIEKPAIPSGAWPKDESGIFVRCTQFGY